MNGSKAKALRRAGLRKPAKRVRVARGEMEQHVASEIHQYHRAVIMPLMGKVIGAAAGRVPWYLRLWFWVQAKLAMRRARKAGDQFATA